MELRFTLNAKSSLTFGLIALTAFYSRLNFISLRCNKLYVDRVATERSLECWFHADFVRANLSSELRDSCFHIRVYVTRQRKSRAGSREARHQVWARCRLINYISASIYLTRYILRNYPRYRGNIILLLLSLPRARVARVFIPRCIARQSDRGRLFSPPSIVSQPRTSPRSHSSIASTARLNEISWIRNLQ